MARIRTYLLPWLDWFSLCQMVTEPLSTAPAPVSYQQWGTGCSHHLHGQKLDRSDLSLYWQLMATLGPIRIKYSAKPLWDIYDVYQQQLNGLLISTCTMGLKWYDDWAVLPTSQRRGFLGRKLKSKNKYGISHILYYTPNEEKMVDSLQFAWMYSLLLDFMNCTLFITWQITFLFIFFLFWFGTFPDNKLPPNVVVWCRQCLKRIINISAMLHTNC